MTTDAYKAAGVDIDAGEAVVDGIVRMWLEHNVRGYWEVSVGLVRSFPFKVVLKTPFW